MSHAHEIELLALPGSGEGAVIGYQTLCREVNERIRALAQPVEGGMELICECDVAACREPIPIRPEEYDAVRASPARFLVRPGHERAGERIVAVTRRFVVVERGER